MQEEIILIPKSRIAVLIGEKGRDKNMIQKVGKCSLYIDSKTGEVAVQAKDAVTLWKACDVVKAVARGFPPEVARKLFKENFGYELISIGDFTRKEGDEPRLRGRVIGQKGLARNRIQTLTQTIIRVQGKTIMILGEVANLDLARRAMEMLLNGAPHPRVYMFLQEQVKGRIEEEK